LILDEKIKSDERIASMKTKFQLLSKAKWVAPLIVGEEESLYALIPEGKAVTTKFSNLFSNAKNDIFWIATLQEILHVTSLLSTEIKGAVHKGVKFRQIIEDFRPDESQMTQVQHALDSKSASTRFNGQPLNNFAVFDGKEAIISTKRKNTPEYTSALWTTDANLIGVLGVYFELEWGESEELNKTISN
jgi:hypothetical protein